MTAIPDFTTVDFEPQSATGAAPSEPVWETPESIPVKPVYTADDIAGLDFLETRPGLAPYLRGPYP
ncbi:MAG: methylmalonyl-CoA mutase family protein, partial [Hyphomicrobiales bacterium]|nr:methylmalonyl-CoA mutase family protein [Hyphomicrobiales bacterium]